MVGKTYGKSDTWIPKFANRLRVLDDQLHRSHKLFVVALVPQRDQLQRPGGHEGDPEEQAISMSGVAGVDLWAVFRRASGVKLFQSDGHPSEAGCVLIGDAIANAIVNGHGSR